jgi:hypothetical protein
MVCQAGFAPGLTPLLQHRSPVRTPQAPVGALGSCGLVLGTLVCAARGPAPAGRREEAHGAPRAPTAPRMVR